MFAKAQVRKKLCGDACVLGSDDVCQGQGRGSARGDIAKVADRRGDDIQAW